MKNSEGDVVESVVYTNIFVLMIPQMRHVIARPGSLEICERSN